MTGAVNEGPNQKGHGSPGPFSSRTARADSKSPGGKPGASRSALTLEEENDLRQFLKLVRGVEWGCKRKRGHSDVSRVIEKLKAIGVSDLSELMRRVSSRKINEDLAEAGYPRFSKDTLESIRKQSSLIRALEHLNESNYRQIGVLAPASQMLSSQNLVYRASLGPSGLRSSLASARIPPETAGGSQAKRLNDSPGISDSQAGGSAGEPGTLLHMSTEDGLAYRPLHLRGLWQKGRRGLASQGQAASLPDLRRSEELHLQQPCHSSDSGIQPRHGLSVSPEVEQHPARGLAAASAEKNPSRGRESTLVRNSPMAGMQESQTGSSQTRCRSVSFKVPQPGPDTPRLMEKLIRTSAQMSGEQRAARWTSLKHSSDSLCQHGEAMLKEQGALEARVKLFREMEAEGVNSPLRQHVARKIRGRLREEQERDGQGTLDQVEIQQRSINIRKHLGLMSNLRRELQVLKRNAFEEDDDSRSKHDESTPFMRGAWAAQRGPR